mgnify:CR=1 FL=1
MKRSRFTTEQIIGILKEQEGGSKAGELARRHGVSEHTIYRWKAKSGGMDVSEAQRLKHLEDENRRLKHMVADQALDIQALRCWEKGGDDRCQAQMQRASSETS